MTPLMNRVREFLKKNPVAGWAIAVGVVSLAGYFVAGRLFGGTSRPAAVPAPPAVATPAHPTPAPTTAPAPTATPAPTQPLPRVSGPTVVPSGPTGRADPFVPLVTAGPPPGSAPPPPPAGTLPPPPFPVPPPPPGVGLPPPPLPGSPGAPGAPPIEAGGFAITGIVGNSHAVAILNFGGRTEIVAEGETIGDLKVLNIDSVRRVVQFLRAGKRFEVRMGGE